MNNKYVKNIDIPPSHVRKLSIIIVYALFFAVLNETVFTVSTPRIAQQYDLLPSQVSWMVTMFILTFSIGQVIFGKLSDRYDIRLLIISGTLIYIFASFLGLIVQNWYSLILVDRAIQGIGASALKALSLVIIARYFPPAQRAKLFGIFTSVEAFAMAMGPVVGGYVSTYLHWSFLFLIPVFLLPIVPLFRYLPKSDYEERGERVDFIGASILSGSIAFIVLFCTDPQWYYLLPGLIGVLFFGIRIKRAADPFVEPELFKNLRFLVALTICFIVIGTVMGIVFVYPLLLTDLFDLEPDRIGFLMFPGAVCSVVFGIVAGNMTARSGSRLVYYLGFILILTALIAMTVMIDKNVIIASTALALLYAGLAFAQTSLTETITRTLPNHQVGIGMGFFGLSAGVASAIGTAVFSKLLSHNSPSDPAVSDSMSGLSPYSIVFILAATLIGLCGLLYAIQFRQQAAVHSKNDQLDS